MKNLEDVRGNLVPGPKFGAVHGGGGWQHWLSPQIEFRPEIGWYESLNAKAFNGDSKGGIPPTKNTTLIGASDVILHF